MRIIFVYKGVNFMKYNIAISGTFNVENYGDLMFPVIFKKAMEKRGLDFNLFLFSPERSCPKALDENTYVYSISEIDKLHSEHHFDTIVVGGGALVHYNKIVVKFPDSTEHTKYDITESWLYPIEFAMRNGIKLLFNLPQVPFPFDEVFKEITQSAFNGCDYISFRDDISKQYLIDAYNNSNFPNIEVFPDSVCCMADLIDKSELAKIRSTVLPVDDNYAVLQFNPQKPQEDDQYLIQIVNTLKSQNLKVVLLPIGYTHNDDFVLDQFNKNHNLNCELISKKLNIMETAAVLSGCEIYIGSSFHGAITAIAYGKKAISYNYISPKNKNQEIFKMYDISNFVVDNAHEALILLNDLYEGKISFSPKIDKISSILNQYFDDLLLKIKDEKSVSNNDYGKFVNALIKLLPELSRLTREKTQLLADLDNQKEYSVKLESIINQHLEHISNLENYCNSLEKSNQSLENNNKDQYSYIRSIETALDATEQQLINVQEAYNKIKNNLFIRIILYIKRLFIKKN